MDVTFGTEVALAVGTVLVSIGVSWGTYTTKQKNDDIKFEEIERRFKAVEEWRYEHEKDASDRRALYERQMAEMSGNFRVIQEQLRSLSKKIDELKHERRRRSSDGDDEAA